MGSNCQQRFLEISEFKVFHFATSCCPHGPLPHGADTGPLIIRLWGLDPKIEIIRGLITRQQW